MDTQDPQQLFVGEVALLEKLRAGPVPHPVVIRCVDWADSLIEFGLAEEDEKGMLHITEAGRRSDGASYRASAVNHVRTISSAR
jgi:hypothetical protein